MLPIVVKSVIVFLMILYGCAILLISILGMLHKRGVFALVFHCCSSHVLGGGQVGRNPGVLMLSSLCTVKINLGTTETYSRMTFN